ncbi:hypothetical protein BC940DRAFT_312158 [Gongronella butleri]|nr:hypothetical protein BC940DRAFT_312158 [Gongronella butleri]
MAAEPDLKALATTLSASYSALLQYQTLQDDKIVEHVILLATHSEHLPLTWFTEPLVRCLLTLVDRFLGTEQMDGVGALVHLLSVWTRRLSGTTDRMDKEPLLPLVLTLFADQLIELPMNEAATVDLRKHAWMGLVALVGRAPAQYDEEKLLATMTRIVRHYVGCTQFPLVESLNAGVAHALAESTRLNVFEYASCKDLLDAALDMNGARPLDGPWAVATLIEHVVDIRSRMNPVTRAESHIDTLATLLTNVTNTETPTLISLAAVAGFVRMMQFNQGHHSAKITATQEKMQGAFLAGLGAALAQRHSEEDKTTIAFFCSQCLPSMPLDAMASLDLITLLHELVDQLLTSPYTWQQGRFLRENVTAANLDALQSHRLFKDIGRLSRAIGKVVHAMLELHIQGATTAIQVAVDKLEGFSYNILLDWDRYKMAHSDNVPDKEIDAKVWPILKTLVFSLTAVLKAIAVDVLDGQGLIDVPHAAQGIVSVYANVNFISERLGLGNGFQAYQDTLTNAVAYLKHKENACQLNRLTSLAFKEYGTPQFTVDQTPTTSLLSSTHSARLLFFMNMVEQVMDTLEDRVLDNDVLPVMYPILKWDTILDKDLYESAHAAVLSVFANQKPVSRELAGVYATILLDHFHKPLTLHQIRLAYVTMVQSLSQLDDAVAWLTVQQALQRREKLTSEKDAVERADYLVLLIDLLKPLSLGPFFGKALYTVERLIKQLETKTMQQSTLKIVHETVSGSGISDMRRVEAVGWYLALKNQLDL